MFRPRSLLARFRMRRADNQTSLIASAATATSCCRQRGLQSQVENEMRKSPAQIGKGMYWLSWKNDIHPCEKALRSIRTFNGGVPYTESVYYKPWVMVCSPQIQISTRMVKRRRVKPQINAFICANLGSYMWNARQQLCLLSWRCSQIALSFVGIEVPDLQNGVQSWRKLPTGSQPQDRLPALSLCPDSIDNRWM